MAKKLSKKQRQKLKQKQQNKLIRQGYDRKQVEALSNANLQKLATANISQVKSKDVNKTLKTIDRREKDRQRQQAKRDKLRSQRLEKLEHLEKIIGTDTLSFDKQPTARFLDSLDLEKLRKGKYKRTDFREYIPSEKLKPIETFDFEKVYQIPKGKLHFAYRSLDGGIDIGEVLKDFSRYSNEDLISFLKTIKNMPQTGSKSDKGSRGKTNLSSGKPGAYIMRLGSQSALNEEYQEEYNADRRSDTKIKRENEKRNENGNTFNKLLSQSAKNKGIGFQKDTIDYHWQSIKQKDENGRLKAYTEITPRKLLIIGNAILWNITEAERQGAYNKFYDVCIKIIPEMKKILP